MHDLFPKEKRKSRIISLQAIYANELNGSEIDNSMDFISSLEAEVINNKSSNADLIAKKAEVNKNIILYSRHLFSITIKHQMDIDVLIKKKSKNWDFERIAVIDKLILRMALSEMLYEDAVPPKVSITEGVEIAKRFSTDESSSFINGILDSVYNDNLNSKKKLV